MRRAGSRHAGRIGRIAFERDDAAAAPRHRLLEGSLDHRAIGIVRHHRRERTLAARHRVIDDAMHVGLRQEAQEIDAARRDIGVGRERDHRHAARPRDLADSADRLREQRADDDRGAFGERLLRRLLRACGVPPSSFTRSWMFGIAEFRDRHFGRVLHRGGGNAGIARQRRAAASARPARRRQARPAVAGLHRV